MDITISFDGQVGSGKSTMLHICKRALEDFGFEVSGPVNWSCHPLAHRLIVKATHTKREKRARQMRLLARIMERAKKDLIFT